MRQISIIVPIYNVEKYIKECLDSVYSQSLTTWECICIDDGSTDNSATILDNYARKDTRFKVTHQPNSGVSDARNRAVTQAQGDYIIFLDGDDLLFQDTLLRIAPHLDCHVLGFVSTLAEKNFTSPSPFSVSSTVNVTRRSSFEIAYHCLYNDALNIRALAGGKIIARHLAKKYKFPTGITLMEDLCYWSALLSESGEWCVADIQYYAYRRRTNSATAELTMQKRLDAIKVLRIVSDHLQGLPIRDKYLLFWEKRGRGFELHLYVILKNWNNLSTDAKEKVLETLALLQDSYPFVRGMKTLRSILLITYSFRNYLLRAALFAYRCYLHFTKR